MFEPTVYELAHLKQYDPYGRYSSVYSNHGSYGSAGSHTGGAKQQWVDKDDESLLAFYRLIGVKMEPTKDDIFKVLYNLKKAANVETGSMPTTAPQATSNAVRLLHTLHFKEGEGGIPLEKLVLPDRSGRFYPAVEMLMDRSDGVATKHLDRDKVPLIHKEVILGAEYALVKTTPPMRELKEAVEPALKSKPSKDEVFEPDPTEHHHVIAFIALTIHDRSGFADVLSRLLTAEKRERRMRDPDIQLSEWAPERVLTTLPREIQCLESIKLQYRATLPNGSTVDVTPTTVTKLSSMGSAHIEDGVLYLDRKMISNANLFNNPVMKQLSTQCLGYRPKIQPFFEQFLNLAAFTSASSMAECVAP